VENGQTFSQSYNADNCLSLVLLVSGTCETWGDALAGWYFTYDGDGRGFCTPECLVEGSRVKQVYSAISFLTT
jgi:hypothetical protein